MFVSVVCGIIGAILFGVGVAELFEYLGPNKNRARDSIHIGVGLACLLGGLLLMIGSGYHFVKFEQEFWQSQTGIASVAPVEPYSLVEADEKCRVWLVEEQLEVVGYNNGVILRNAGTQELPVSVTFPQGVTMTALLAEHGEVSLVSKEALNSALPVWLSFVTDGNKSEFDFRRCPAMSLPQSTAEQAVNLKE